MSGYHHEFDDPQRPDFERLSPSEIRYIEGLEKLHNSNSTSIVTNNKFPYWSVDRWLVVVAALAGVGAWLFGAGQQWNGMSEVRSLVVTHIEAAEASYVRRDVLDAQLAAINQKLASIEEKLR